MSSHLERIDHKGKHILYFDFSDLFGEEYLQTLNEVKDFILDLQQDDLLLLVNVSQTYADKKILMQYNEIGKQIKSSVAKVAVIGVSKTQDVFLSMINLVTGVDAKTFRTFDEAKEWLIK